MVGSQQTLDNDSTLFEILSHHRRRHALGLMTGDDRSWSISELATEITDREHDGRFAGGKRTRIDAVRATLYHTHLPKLADAGLVEFDEDRKTAILTTAAGAVDRNLFSS